MLGTIGHLFTVISFVSLISAMIAYFLGNGAGIETNKKDWLKHARASFVIHGLAVLGTIGTLFYIIYFHHFEYEYAWKHASKDLPVHFIISSFWEGQEGSFLLWIFWNVCLGMILISSLKPWEMKVMPVFCCIQLFLVSMVLGVYVNNEVRIGSSPFMLLRDVLESEIFKLNPNFVPENGTGLNPLLQNIWMVIHPPVIFLGFALSGVPFSLAIAALWGNRLDGFMKIVTPWVLACAGVLGVGIILGAYWAYETLNFGGYWNWDPVENAIFIPWLIFLAAIHGLVLYRRHKKALDLTFIFVIAGFLLILYSTFLTRSGILGNASVHAFTDLGLSGQLLLFLIFFIVLSCGMLIFRRRAFYSEEQSASVFSLEFWMILGICALCLSSFQVLIPTSIPVINVILENMGLRSNFAPPSDPVDFYNNFQIWFGVAFCLIAATGQLFYWRKIQNKEDLEHQILTPIAITLVISSVFIYFGKTHNISYICMVSSAVYLIVINIHLFISLIKNIKRTSLGGILAHTGMAMMLIGFVYSGGHKKVVSRNMTIMTPDTALPEHILRENLLVSRNIPKDNNGYTITYKGANYQNATTGSLIPMDFTIPGRSGEEKMIKKPLFIKKGETLKPGDVIQVNEENIFFTIEMANERERFVVHPRMQNNPSMGFIASPDIKSFLFKDIYTHVSNFPDPQKIEWSETMVRTVTLGETFEYNGLQFTLENIEVVENPAGIKSFPGDMPLEAAVRVVDQYSVYEANPLFYVDKNLSVRLFPDEITAIGAKVFLTKVDPVNQLYELSVSFSQRDWITLVSIEMPFICFVWIGAIFLTSGIGLATCYRLLEVHEKVGG